MNAIDNTSQIPTKLDRLAFALTEAKRSEALARDARMAAEQAIIDLLGEKDEGTITEKTEWYKVSTTTSLNRSLKPDWETQLAGVRPSVIQEVIRFKPEISVSGLKHLATRDPSAYGQVLKAIVTKPAKTSVKVELLQREAA